MRDPRLAEIDFLSDLERSTAPEFFVNGKLGGKTGGGQSNSLYGLDANRFREMVIDLIGRGCVVGHAIRTPDATINAETLRYDALRLARDFANGFPQSVLISHAGRLHLWSQRDVLLRDADVEPFGLLSRAAWERDLFVRLRFAAADAPLSVILLDLDDFGQVNKILGMPVGDAVLRVAFALIKNLVGTRGSVYRCGGEEVGVLLPATEQTTAATIAEELRAALQTEVRAQVPQLTVAQTASIGVRAFASPGDYDVVVGQVDELVRSAKAAGKNQVHVAV